MLLPFRCGVSLRVMRGRHRGYVKVIPTGRTCVALGVTGAIARLSCMSNGDRVSLVRAKCREESSEANQSLRHRQTHFQVAQNTTANCTSHNTGEIEIAPP